MLKKYILAAACVFVCIIIFEGCLYNKADQQYPSTGAVCDTTDIHFSIEIKAILDANCKTCHDGTASISGIDLYNHQIISTLALDGQFTYGTLLSAVMHKGGAPMMPQDKPMLDSCSIHQIAAWVHSGAPDN